MLRIDEAGRERIRAIVLHTITPMAQPPLETPLHSRVANIITQKLSDANCNTDLVVWVLNNPGGSFGDYENFASASLPRENAAFLSATLNRIASEMMFMAALLGNELLFESALKRCGLMCALRFGLELANICIIGNPSFVKKAIDHYCKASKEWAFKDQQKVGIVQTQIFSALEVALRSKNMEVISILFEGYRALSKEMHFSSLAELLYLKDCFVLCCKSQNTEGAQFVYESASSSARQAIRNTVERLRNHPPLFAPHEFEAGNRALAEIDAWIFQASQDETAPSRKRMGIFDHHDDDAVPSKHARREKTVSSNNITMDSVTAATKTLRLT
jgi:hypothetical protein